MLPAGGQVQGTDTRHQRWPFEFRASTHVLPCCTACSTAEKAGLSLSKIESMGLLSTAENLGLLTAAENLLTTDPGKISSGASKRYCCVYCCCVYCCPVAASVCVCRLSRLVTSRKRTLSVNPCP